MRLFWPIDNENGGKDEKEQNMDWIDISINDSSIICII